MYTKKQQDKLLANQLNGGCQSLSHNHARFFFCSSLLVLTTLTARECSKLQLACYLTQKAKLVPELGFSRSITVMHHANWDSKNIIAIVFSETAFHLQNKIYPM